MCDPDLSVGSPEDRAHEEELNRCEVCDGSGRYPVYDRYARCLYEITCPECLRDGQAPANRNLCVDCGKNYADPPSELCPGCEAFRAHQA